MEALISLVKKLIEYPTEEEWFEFKDSWYDAYAIGEYISSLSNAAALAGKREGFLIWGVDDDTHELTNTEFSYRQNVRNEPLEHYLARQVTPDLGFSFHELDIDGNRVVVLVVPAAKIAPTSFNGTRFLRIGSSKVNLAKYPERESKLFEVLRHGLPTMENTPAYEQDLTFRKLLLYYEEKGITLNPQTFEKNLGLRTEEGRYNFLAQILSDNSQISVRVSIFKGNDKASPLYSVREFGNTCMLVTLDKILEYGDVLNIMQANEHNRLVEREEVPLFDQPAFREALVNAFVHNSWIEGNAPMITVYSDRIEILSRGTLAPSQTMEGFFKGESVPVNRRLSDIFLQLHISERSGRGVPAVTAAYGRGAYEFRANSIVVGIPFKIIEPASDKSEQTPKAKAETTVLQARILQEMRENPSVSQAQLAEIVGESFSTVKSNIRTLRENGLVNRVGPKKTGKWMVN